MAKNNKKEEKYNSCKHSFPRLVEKEGKYKIERHCVVDDWEDENGKIVSKEDCKNCNRYGSKFIEYPIQVNNVKTDTYEWWKSYECGTLVKIRPCKEEYEGKTYLGILLGDLPCGNGIMYFPKDKELSVNFICNPAIFVPDLKKIIFGYESWWGKIENEDELKDITDEDINNVWYVKLLNGINKKD